MSLLLSSSFDMMDTPDISTVKEELPLESVPTSSTSEFPEGGFAGWATVAGA